MSQKFLTQIYSIKNCTRVNAGDSRFSKNILGKLNEVFFIYDIRLQHGVECNVPKMRNVPFRGLRLGDTRIFTPLLVNGSADAPNRTRFIGYVGSNRRRLRR